MWHDVTSQPTSFTEDAIPSTNLRGELATWLNDSPAHRGYSSSQRSLPRRRSVYRIRNSGSRGVSTPIRIPVSEALVNTWAGPASGDPLQRWQNSPPEDEAANLSAIYNALQDTSLDLPGRGTAGERGGTQPRRRTSSTRRPRRTASETSFDSVTSASSRRSGGSIHSGASSASRSQRSRSTRVAKSRARPSQRTATDKERIFQCTFCCDTFKHKYDWVRHEKSLHLNMEEWRCAPHGASVVMEHTGRVHCAYCSALDPTPEHLETHNYHACQGTAADAPVFRRKDHLVQHLRLVHRLDTLPVIDDWKIEGMPVASRCGFCNTTLSSWDERASHLAAHFRNGKTMSDWQGDHGFDAAVASRVINAMPPYLLGSQSKSLVPFSATNPHSRDQYQQICSRIKGAAQDAPIEPVTDDTQLSGINAFTEMLTLHLSRFARELMSRGVVPTDEMFQQESRRVCFSDCEDSWNQTVADNPEWLRDFRIRTGSNAEDQAN